MLLTPVVFLAWVSVASAAELCNWKWDTAAVANSEAGVWGIPLEWFQAINIVRRKIDHQSGINTQLFLCESATPNAYAYYARGKNVTAITTGMYLQLRDDWHAYAAIIGHENAHHVLKHLVTRIVRDTAFNIIAAGTELPTIGVNIISNSFSRDEELAADKFGLRYALCAGFSLSGVLRFHAWMDSESSFLASHPSSKNRIKNLQHIAKKHDRKPSCRGG